MKGYGWPKSPRVSDFRPKSGQFWYFLASPLLCRLRLPSGANASTKILPILHLYTNVLLSVKRAKNLACLNLLMFATQKNLSHPSPLFWLSQKIEVRRRRKSNILHPALNSVFSLFWLPGKSGLWEGEKGRLWAVVTISLVWRSHASPTHPASSFTIFNLSLQPQLLWAHFFWNILIRNDYDIFGNDFITTDMLWFYSSTAKNDFFFQKRKKLQRERCVLIMALQYCRSPFNLALLHCSRRGGMRQRSCSEALEFFC